jgi:hypothetical protein
MPIKGISDKIGLLYIETRKLTMIMIFTILVRLTFTVV